MRSPRASSLLIAALICLAAPQRAHACFYSSYTLSPDDTDQASVEGVIYDRYETPKVTVFVQELKKMKEEYEQRKSDPNFLDDAALVAFKAGHTADAEIIWKQLLAREPDRFRTLATYATALQQITRYDEAYSLMSRAAALKPEFRSGVEQLHLKMIDFERKTKADPNYGKGHLFIDELTPIWKEHTEPSKKFYKTKLPTEPIEGIAELLRQYPKFGEGWLVLGMLLEHDRDYGKALQAYRRAERNGTHQTEALKLFLPQYVKFEESRSKVGSAGYGMLRLLVAAVGLFIGYRLVRLFAGIYTDRIEGKRARLEEQYREKRRPPQE